MRCFRLLLLTLVCCSAGVVRAEDPLHVRIDKLILARAGKCTPAQIASDGEFLRRVYLDFTGRIPSATAAREFLSDPASDKRQHLIDKLLASPGYAVGMQERFHVLLMERLGEHPEWQKYLRQAFQTNKPWDQMVREILRAEPHDAKTRGASFFISKRLEHYGQNPIDYPALTRDVGRLFLGVDLRCAQCHDHLFISDYKQHDFQGLFAFFQNTYLADKNKLLVGEKPTTQKLSFMSVFVKKPRETAPRLPGGKEITIPTIAKGKEYLKPADRRKRIPGVLRFSPLAELARRLPRADNQAFTYNSVNRMWFLMMGRGLVHPLDLHHEANPASHPELLQLLAREFAAHKFDIKWLLRQLALSKTYQRSSLIPEGKPKPPPERFLVALEKRLGAEALMWNMLQAVGEKKRLQDPRNKETLETVRKKFLKAFANPPREPEEEFAPTVKSALFILNDPTVLKWLEPRPGNLIDRLNKISDGNKLAEELYLSVLTRLPTEEERATVVQYLKKQPWGTNSRRQKALGRLAWALLASTEFSVNH